MSSSSRVPIRTSALEQERFRNFRVDPSEIERRRTAVVQRGRGQPK
jgi:hypothetical protein